MRRLGMSLLELLVAIAIVATLTALLLPAIQKARAAASRTTCTNNLHQLALALHQHHETQSNLPAATTTKFTTPFLPYVSWCTRILPYLEQDAAWTVSLADYASQSSFSKPVPHRNLARVFPVFICPADGRSLGTNPDGTTAAFTHYLGAAGTKWLFWDGMLYPNSAVRLGQVSDGTANTVMIGERPPSQDNSFGWWYAGAGQAAEGELDSHLVTLTFNRTFRAPMCPKNFIFTFRPGKPDDMCSTFHFWSLHSGGANFAFADGSVRFLRYSADSILPALSTRAGGESVQLE